MEYSIQQLSNLAGVTTRTLRWYDKIGLLKPSRTAESGYRYYGPKEVDRLGVLQSYLIELEARQERLCSLIQVEESNEIMTDEKKFEVFKQNAVDAVRCSIRDTESYIRAVSGMDGTE